MTTYNHEPFIAQAVNSILAQQVNFAYESVIGEDYSTDRTRDILLDLAAEHPKEIRLLLREENWGRRKNFIDVFASCCGEYIAILEGDDYWTSPHKLQIQADFLDAHPESAICFHPVRKQYEDGSREPEIQRPSQRKPFYVLEDLLERTLIITCSVMFRNHLFRAFPQWFDSVPAGDLPLNVLNAQHGNIGYIDEVMAVYRIHSGGAWSSGSLVRRQTQRIEVLEALKQHLGSEYSRQLNDSIARANLRIVQGLGREREYRALFSHLSQMLLRKHMSPASLARVALRAAHARAGSSAN